MAEIPRIGIVVQARMSSRRLPGKVLRPLAGKPLLAHLFERLVRAEGGDRQILSTSIAAEDDAIERFAQEYGILCHRGPLEDVASRLLDAVRTHKCDAIVRISGDSPLLDPALVSEAIRRFRTEQVDLVTNVFPRSFPKGQSVEVISVAALERVTARASADEREHVTAHIYRNADTFRIRNFAADRPRPELQLSVDTGTDFRRVERILRRAGGASATLGLEEIVRIMDQPCLAGSES